MDAGGRKGDPSLPPDYVSLAQLQERWMRMQREKNLEGKNEEDKKGASSGFSDKSQSPHRVLKNEGDKKIEGGLMRDLLRERVENGGGEMSKFEWKEKEKEIAAGDLESGDGTKTKEKKKKKKKKKSGGKKKHFKELEKDGESGDGAGKEKTNGDRFEEVESNGRGGICDELKGAEETETVSMVAAVLPRNGLGERIPNVKGRGYSGGFRRNGDNLSLSRNRLGRGGFRKNDDDQGLLGRRDGRGFRRNGSDHGLSRHRGGKGRGVELDDEPKETGISLALEEKMEGEKGYDKNQKEGGRISIDGDGFQGVDDALKVCELKLESEEKTEDEILEVSRQTSDLKERDGYEIMVHSDNGRDEIQEDKVEEECLMNDSVSMEKPAGDELLAVERHTSGEKRGVRNGVWRYGNGKRRGNTGRRFHGPTIDAWEAGNVRSGVEQNDGFGRKYARAGRFNVSGKIQQRENGKVWVKKGERLGEAAAESGICVDQQ